MTLRDAATRLMFAAPVSLLALPSGLTPAHAAATLLVPSQFSTIQAAIDAASPGDTVSVASGTYQENISFKGKAIAVIAATGPANTVIDGGARDSVVKFNTGEGRNSVLSGFTLQNGLAYTSAPSYDGGGVLVSGASPTISGNVISGNKACDGGGGIYVNGGSPLVSGNKITGNSQNNCSGGVGGGGIALVGAGSAQISGNSITGNSWGSDGGGMTLFAAGTPLVQGNFIQGNSAGYQGQGGGIWAVNQSDATIADNLITGNSASYEGAGMYIAPPSGTRGAWLVNNTVADNLGQGAFFGGFDQQMDVENNILQAGTAQPAVVCDPSYQATPPRFVTNDVWNGSNTAITGPCLANAASSGNLQVDPGFASPASGDYHLAANSTLVNAGTDSAPNLPSTDLDGKPRVSAGIVDMGAYERQIPMAVTGRSFTATEGALWSGTVATFTGGAGPYNATVTWGDGTQSSGSVTQSGTTFTVAASHTFSEEGVPATSVSVTDSTGASAGAADSGSVTDATLAAAGTRLSERRRTSFTATLASFTDADPAGTASDYSATITWGDGSASRGTIVGGSPLSVTGTHTYNGKGTFTVTVQVRDAGGATTSTTTTITSN